MTPEEEAAVEAALSALETFREHDGGEYQGPTALGVLKERLGDEERVLRLARVVSRRAREQRGEEVREGASLSSRSTSGVEPLSPVSGGLVVSERAPPRL